MSMLTYPAVIEVQILVWDFIYIQTSCMQAVKTLAHLGIYAGLPEPLLLNNI